MNKWFYHSILKYRHNQAVDEVLNLGVLFIFPEENHLHFSAPRSLSRIEHAYPGVYVKDIKAYLNSFEAQAKKLQKHKLSCYDDYSAFISDWFLTANGSSIFFSPVQKAPVWKDIPGTVGHFSHLYLEGYGKKIASDSLERHDERYILHKYKSLLAASEKAGQLNLFLREEEVVVESELARVSTDGFWKNGTQNLVKSVSFDLRSDEGIETKALALSKKLELLGKTLTEKHQRIDLLLARPQDPKFSSTYRTAKKVLDDTQAPHCIVEESGYEKYVQEFWQSAKVLH